MEYYFIQKLGHIFCQNKKKELKRLHFFKKWLKVSEAIEPDNIKWENLGYKKTYRKSMVAINWLVAIVILFVSMLLIVLFKVTATEAKTDAGPTQGCGGDVTKE